MNDERVISDVRAVEWGAQIKTAPAGAGNTCDRGPRNHATLRSDVIPYPKSIHLPVVRGTRPGCGHRSPVGRCCNRPAGHTGRHAFYWRHIDGRVREVWA